MDLIFWVDANTFATSLIEKVFKKKDIPFYCVADARDFIYLIEDLNPSVLVFDAQTLLNDLASVRNQYEKSNGFKGKPVIILGPMAGLEFIENKVGELEIPIDPFKVYHQIKKIIED
jgi:hypothetical protein